MNEEQQYINLIFNHLQNGNQTAIENLIPDIDKRFKKSIPLNYYIAYYYEKKGDIDTATKRFNYCIQLGPKFTYPYFHLANYILSSESPDNDGLEKLLLPIFGKKTVSLSTSSGPQFNLQDQLQIVNMIGPTYMRLKKYNKAIPLYKRGLQFLEDYTPRRDTTTDNYHSFKKTFSLALGEATSETDPDESFNYYINGLETSDIPEIDKKLFSGASLGLHYSYLTKNNLSLVLDKLIKKANRIIVSSTNGNDNGNGSSIRKIKVGIMSPDFNKNAVGLFSKALLLNLDKDLFEIIVYYTNPHSDNFTTDFKKYVTNWIDAAFLDDNQLYAMMRVTHSIDILIDLIGPGSMNRLNLISMKPAKVIINYLGYPGTGFLNSYTHRLVDNLTDPQTPDNFHESLHIEKLVRLSRFLNFSLFDGIVLPNIVTAKRETNEIRIGIMNKPNKFNKVIIDAWSEILEKNNRIIFYLKNTTTLPTKFLEKYKTRIKFLPFYEKLENYLDAFNQFDLCLDTFPYSGTTTTCTSLLMGVPLFTIYNPEENAHVSNVSGSILKHVGLTQFLCNDTVDYISKVIQWEPNEDICKSQIRKAFIDNMTNCEEFGNDLSNALQTIFLEK